MDVCGDTNFPNISWQSIKVVPGIRPDNENVSAKMFLSFLEANGMAQYVTIPTRSKDNAENTLDVCVCNSEEHILHIETEETCLSDHDWVSVSLATDFSPCSNLDQSKSRVFGFSSFDFAKADFDRINSYIMNVEWAEILEENPDEFAPKFLEIITQICHLKPRNFSIPL